MCLPPLSRTPHDESTDLHGVLFKLLKHSTYRRSVNMSINIKEKLEISVCSQQPPSTHSTFKGQHPHVHPRQFAVGDLQLLQRVGEAGGEGVVLLGHNGELLLGLLYVPGANRSERGEGKAARVTSSICQASG